MIKVMFDIAVMTNAFMNPNSDAFDAVALINGKEIVPVMSVALYEAYREALKEGEPAEGVSRLTEEKINRAMKGLASVAAPAEIPDDRGNMSPEELVIGAARAGVANVIVTDYPGRYAWLMSPGAIESITPAEFVRRFAS